MSPQPRITVRSERQRAIETPRYEGDIHLRVQRSDSLEQLKAVLGQRRRQSPAALHTCLLLHGATRSFDSTLLARDRPIEPSPGDQQLAPASTDFASALTEVALTEAFWERLRLFAGRRLGDVRLGEDVAQETLHRVIHSIRTGALHTPEALPAFVFATARHVCQHRERSVQREERAFLRFGSDLRSASQPPDPLAELLGAERRETVRRALGSLSEPDRLLLRALFFDQRDPADVARELGSTAGALRVRKHRALQRLAELIAGLDG